ncbi:MAG: hypothetical protein ACK4MV_05685 [Beijerinckiaceae bacterium]
MSELLLEQRTERAERIARHMAERVRACVATDSPFQHFHLTGVFPEDVYAEMRRSMPPREAYLPINIKRWKNAEGVSTRDRLALSDGEMGRVPENIRALWEDVTAALTSRQLQQAVYSVLRNDIALRLNCAPQDVLNQDAYASVLLVRDFEEYYLKPHPDGQPRVVTVMFYLADEDSPTDLGTSMYRRKPLISRLLGGRFEEVGRFPYLPNSVAVFAVNDTPERTSWHGRELITGPSVVRDSIILSYLSESRPDFGSKHNY